MTSKQHRHCSSSASLSAEGGALNHSRPAFCCTLSTFTYTHNKRVHPKFHLIATFCTSYTAQLHRSHTQ